MTVATEEHINEIKKLAIKEEELVVGTQGSLSDLMKDINKTA